VAAALRCRRRSSLAERGGQAVSFVAPPRATRHVRHLHKYADREVAPHHRFAFQLPAQAPVAVAATLGELRRRHRSGRRRGAEHHAARGTSPGGCWTLDDRDLGVRLRKVERRWAHGEIGDLRPALIQPLGPVVEDLRSRPEVGDSEGVRDRGGATIPGATSPALLGNGPADPMSWCEPGPRPTAIEERLEPQCYPGDMVSHC
jgi:hypothetical protein